HVALGDFESLGERQVDLREAGTLECVAATVPNNAGSGERETRNLLGSVVIDTVATFVERADLSITRVIGVTRVGGRAAAGGNGEEVSGAELHRRAQVPAADDEIGPARYAAEEALPPAKGQRVNRCGSEDVG